MALKYRDYAPALKQGAKVFPEDLAGMLGLPSVGNIWYVDAGKSASGGGTSREDAFITVAEGLAAATADNDDVILVTGSTSTGRTSESEIDWSKRRTHLIGNGAPRRMNSRNGISFNSTATSPCFTVSANDCIIANVSLGQFNDVNVLCEVTSDYNTFMNVHFQGIGNATTGDDTAARSLLLTAAEENEFINCTIGIDTVARSVANASLELTGSCPRNKFIGCDFPIYTDNAGPNWVKANVGNCYERFLMFQHCMFMNPTVVGGSTIMTEGMDTHATGNGTIVLDGCGFLGMTNVADDFTAVHSINTATVPTQATACFMQVLA